MPVKKRSSSMPKNTLWQVDLPAILTSVWEGYVEREGFGPSVSISFIKNGRILTVELTEMTEPEIMAFKEVINAGIELAIPICIGRDKKANELNAANADDIFPRLYRSVPKVVARPRTVGLDGAQLLLRPVDDATNTEA